jgi:hypothetical protein
MEELKQVTEKDKSEKLSLKRILHEITDYVNESSETVGLMQKTLTTALVLMSKLGAQLSIARSLLFEVFGKRENGEVDS